MGMTEQIMRTTGRFGPVGQVPPERGPGSRFRFSSVVLQFHPAPAPGDDAGPMPDRQPGAEPGALLSRLWLDALADEQRYVAPFERMATALLAFVGAVSLLMAGGAVSQLIERWDTFAALVQRLLL